MISVLKLAIRRRLKRLLVIVASLMVVYSGAAAIAHWIRRIRKKGSITILAYHEISEPTTFRAASYVTRAEFDRHLTYISKKCRIASLDEIVSMFQQGSKPLQDTVAITFDDGCLDNLCHALPILHKHASPSTVFVATGFIDQTIQPWWQRFNKIIDHIAQNKKFDLNTQVLPNEISFFFRSKIGRKALCFFAPEVAVRLSELSAVQKRSINEYLDSIVTSDSSPMERSMMNWEEVRKLADQGVSIGAHSVSHNILTSIPGPQAQREINMSKARIQLKLGESPKYFSYPVGYAFTFDKNIEAIIAEAGYAAAFTMIHGQVRPESDIYALSRKGIANYPLFVLKANLSGLLDYFYF